MMTIMLDEPLRLTIVTTDGKTHSLDVASYTIDGAVKRAPPKPKEEKAPSSQKVYPVPDLVDEDARAMIRGEADDPEWCAKKENRKRTIEVLCGIRRRAFKMTDAVTYTVRDAQIIDSMMAAGVLPSTMAKAVVSASRDEYWTKRGDLDVVALKDNAARLAAKFESSKTDPRALVEASMAKLAEIDPAFADGVRSALADRNANVADILVRVRNRIAKG